ncbi:MAG TPA: hypothetical protein VEI97_00295 [bacterium]|nr:hypothetical protein [bacterium]
MAVELPYDSSVVAAPAIRERTRWVPLLCGVLLILMLPALAHRGRFGVSPDSYSYLSAAINVSQGRGLVLSQVDPVTPTTPDGRVRRRPLTQWPPLYPLLVAALVACRADPLQAGWAVAYASTTIALLLAWLLVLRSTPRWAAIPAAFLLATLPGATLVAVRAWSEGTALACLMAIHLLLDEALDRRSATRRGTWPAIAVLTLLGLYTRYAFVFVIPWVALGMWWAWRRWRPVVGYVAMVTAGYLPWLGWNVLESGHLSGRALRPAHQGPLEVVIDVARHLLGRELPALTGSLIVLGFLLLLRRNWRTLAEHALQQRVTLLVIAGAGQLLLLAASLTRHRFDPVGIRFTGPITVLFAVALLLVLAHPRRTRARGPGLRIEAGVAAAILLFNAAAFCRPIAPYTLEVPPSLVRFFRESIPPGAVYAGDRCAAALQVHAPDCRYLPSLGVRMRGGAAVSADDLAGLTAHLGLEFLVLLDAPLPPLPPGSRVLYGAGWAIVDLDGSNGAPGFSPRVPR